MNRIFSSICQVEGNFKVGQINLTCWLLDEEHSVHGRWQHQRIELARFAFRYNERSFRNIFIKINPVNGEIMVTLSFFTGETILED